MPKPQEIVTELHKKYGISSERGPTGMSRRVITRDGMMRLMRDYPGKERAKTALGISWIALTHFETAHNMEWPKTNVSIANRIIPMPGVERKILKRPNLPWEYCIILPDPHVPFHNVNLMNEMVRFAEKEKITKLLIAGDLLDFTNLYRKDIQRKSFPTRTYLREGERVLDVLSQTFDEIVTFLGNHDWRLMRTMASVEDAMEIYKKFTAKASLIDYNYAIINNWLWVTHPFKGRKAKGGMSEELGDHNQMSNIITHTHRFSFGVHDNGKEIIGDGLHMTDPKMHSYVMQWAEPFSAWVPGFWVVFGKRVYPYVKHPRIYNPLEV